MTGITTSSVRRTPTRRDGRRAGGAAGGTICGDVRVEIGLHDAAGRSAGGDFLEFDAELPCATSHGRRRDRTLARRHRLGQLYRRCRRGSGSTAGRRRFHSRLRWRWRRRRAGRRVLRGRARWRRLRCRAGRRLRCRIGGWRLRRGRCGNGVPAVRRRRCTTARALDADQLGADGQHLADFAAERQHAAGDGGRNLDRRLVGQHVRERLIFVHLVADLDVPGNEFDFGDAFAQIGHLDRVCAHHASIARWKAAATRAGLGK